MLNDDPRRFHAMVKPVAAAVRSLIDAHEGVMESRHHPDPDASQVLAQIADQRRYSIPEIATWPVEDALSIGGVFMFAGCDHARAICTLVDARPAVIYADKVLLRAAVEALARGAWLLDPSAGTQERVRRVINERLYSLTRQCEHGKGTEKAREGRKRRDELFHQALALGLGDEGRGDGHVWLKPKRPSATAVIRHLLDRPSSSESKVGAIFQGTYSDFVHSTLWALNSRVVRIDDEDAPAIPSPTTLRGIASSAEDVSFTLAMAGGALVAAGDDHRSLMGWHDEEWSSVKAEAVAVLAPLVRTT